MPSGIGASTAAGQRDVQQALPSRPWICFWEGATRAIALPCWGLLKPETLEVNIRSLQRLHKTLSGTGALQMWSLSREDILDSLVSKSYPQQPHTLTHTHSPPLPSPPDQGLRPPWAGQQPLLTPAIKLKSYSPISRLWSVQSIADWPLMRLWPQHMFCTHV